MADAPAAAAGKAGKGGLDFLTKKVGPLPMFVWLGAGLVIYLYFQRKQAKTTPAAGANQQTDPAGNVGSIDPATGYVYGTPEDTAALAAQNSGNSSDTGSSGSSGSTGSPKYADNNAWGIAAVNYLVGLGIDATTANQAIELYLSSQPLSTSQQGDVNLAIQALGPPPTLPGPVTGNPPPVTTPGHPINGGNPPHGPWKKTAPPPAGLVVAAKSSHSLRVKWNRSTGATGYHVLCTDQASKKVESEHDVSAATLTAVFSGLQPSHSYVVDVWALPRASGNGPHAQVSATLPRTG